MPGMRRSRAPSAGDSSRNAMTGMAGMAGQPGGHAGMQGMQGMTDSATLKLQRLLSELVEDPLVRQRILADSALRKDWQDPAVRRAIRGQP